jgi:ElaB/YqjD/DUF883 family membrane-anchored ribosome-binding protein
MRNTTTIDIHPKSDRSTRDGVLYKAATGTHNVVDTIAGAADDTARKAIPAIDRATEYAHQTVDNAVTGIAPAAEWLDQQAADLNAAQRKLVSSAREYVAANPLTSLGIALATGFLVSLFIRK